MNNEKFLHWRLRRSCGKVGTELDKITNPKSGGSTSAYVMTISRTEILECDFSASRALFSLENDPEKLRSLLGRVTLAICGFDQTEGELFEVPEVRSYFTEVNYHYPYWLPFLTLESHVIRLIAACVGKNLDAMRTRDGHFSALRMIHGEVEEFFVNAIPLTGAIHRASGIAPGASAKRMREVGRHLGLL